MIMDSAPPPLYESDLQFFDVEDEELNSQHDCYLQISVHDGVDPRVVRFVVPSDK